METLFDVLEDIFEAIAHPFFLGVLFGSILTNIYWIVPKYLF